MLQKELANPLRTCWTLQRMICYNLMKLKLAQISEFIRLIHPKYSLVPNAWPEMETYKLDDMNVKSVNDIEHLHKTNDIMFINELKTYGYSCSLTFVRRRNPRPSVNENVLLDINDFNQDEIENLFGPCIVDRGCSHAFTGYYGNNEVRRMSTKEFYSYGGTLSRSKTQDRLKTESGIKAIKSGITCVKSISIDNYKTFMNYIFRNMDKLFQFYGFNTAQGICKLLRRGKFKLDDKTKMPIMIFCDGMFNKDAVRFKGHQHGVT
ncbi:hypothetical protein BD770DRAFT_413103 [Pilaira anomala]|nr:hypothetical protein BD770DRAFT_413103 [Pilaira anomala]